MGISGGLEILDLIFLFLIVVLLLELARCAPTQFALLFLDAQGSKTLADLHFNVLRLGLSLVRGCKAKLGGVQGIQELPLPRPCPHRGGLPHVPDLEVVSRSASNTGLSPAMSHTFRIWSWNKMSVVMMKNVGRFVMLCHTCDVVTRHPGHCDERARPVTASLWAERVHTGLESFLSTK